MYSLYTNCVRTVRIQEDGMWSVGWEEKKRDLGWLFFFFFRFFLLFLRCVRGQSAPCPALLRPATVHVADFRINKLDSRYTHRGRRNSLNRRLSEHCAPMRVSAHSNKQLHGNSWRDTSIINKIQEEEEEELVVVIVVVMIVSYTKCYIHAPICKDKFSPTTDAIIRFDSSTHPPTHPPTPFFYSLLSSLSSTLTSLSSCPTASPSSSSSSRRYYYMTCSFGSFSCYSACSRAEWSEHNALRSRKKEKREKREIASNLLKLGWGEPMKGWKRKRKKCVTKKGTCVSCPALSAAAAAARIHWLLYDSTSPCPIARANRAFHASSSSSIFSTSTFLLICSSKEHKHFFLTQRLSEKEEEE